MHNTHKLFLYILGQYQQVRGSLRITYDYFLVFVRTSGNKGLKLKVSLMEVAWESFKILCAITYKLESSSNMYFNCSVNSFSYTPETEHHHVTSV